jgi:hypothetical protein
MFLDASFPTTRVPAPTATAATAIKRERFSMPAVVDETDEAVVVVEEEEEGVDATVLTVVTAAATTVVIGLVELDD